MTRPPWDRASKAVVVGLCTVKALVQLLVVDRYGYHGDELYFIECGRHLAFGYVDHPPLIPWIARLAEQLGGGLLLLRLPAILAATGAMVCTALLVRSWGGGWQAQLLALLYLLLAPANLRMAAMLDIPVWRSASSACLRCHSGCSTPWWVPRSAGRFRRWPSHTICTACTVGTGTQPRSTVCTGRFPRMSERTPASSSARTRKRRPSTCSARRPPRAPSAVT